MMRTNLCKKEFQQGQQLRESNPFSSSIYKLKEDANRLEECSLEICRIAAYKRGRGHVWDMRHCTPTDISTYLKGLPVYISQIMGSDILPGLDGLRGDGVSYRTIDMLKTKFLPLIDQLINDCNAVQKNIRANIHYEYHNFRKGESDIKELSESAVSIINEILIDAGHSMD